MSKRWRLNQKNVHRRAVSDVIDVIACLTFFKSSRWLPEAVETVRKLLEQSW